MSTHARNVVPNTARDVGCDVAPVASRRSRRARLGATPPIDAMLRAEEAS
jgi:hypothetical protein